MNPALGKRRKCFNWQDPGVRSTLYEYGMVAMQVEAGRTSPARLRVSAISVEDVGQIQGPRDQFGTTLHPTLELIGYPLGLP